MAEQFFYNICKIFIKKSLRFRYKIFVVFSTLFLYLLMTLCSKYFNDNLMDINYAKKLEEMQLQEYVLKDKGTGCKMPQLDPYAKQTMKYNYDMPQITCPGLDWVECKGDECYVKDEVFNEYNDVKCVYKDILFADDKNLKIGSQVRKYNNEIYKLIESDHVRVSCIAKRLEGLRVPRLWYGFAAGFRRVRVSVPPARHRDSPHVLILAFDSASHNGFLRRLPKSYKVITDELKAVVLKSFNVLGDGTPATLFPLLTGKTELEILDPNIKIIKNNYFDPKDFIFHTMEQYGYRTAFFEDMPSIGTFQYRFGGFRHQPADHYLRSILLDKTKNGKTWWNGLKTRYCMGAVPQYAWMLNLTSQFLKLEGKNFIFTFIVDISHDDFNVITTAEDDLVRFLREFRDSGFRENTLLVVMGDHGSRFSKARQTVQGKLEERLPFLAIALPERFVRDRPDALRALKANVDVLTTPHDLRATILDVVDMRDRWNNYTVPGSDIPRAMTMLEDIPRNRTCAEAGIVPHWCACSQWISVPDTEPVFKEAAEALGHYINEITSVKRSQCKVRKIISIEYVNRLGSPSDVPAARDQFQIKIIMSPGGAVFEGSVVRNNKEKTFTISERDISRTNAYGDQPKCIVKTHPHLQKYCFCNDQQSNHK